jgi:phenylacetate-CoA ligase
VDITSHLERVYAELPIPLQNVVCSVYGLRARQARRGPFFEHKLHELLDSEHWSRERIEQHQSQALESAIRHAFEHVPYYRAQARRLGVSPSQIRSRADLQRLPLLSKEDVRHNFDALVADDVPVKQMRLQHTSGTTGKSLNFYWDANQQAFLWAIWWRHRMRFGLSVDAWHANFTGKLVVPPSQSAPPYWRCNWPLRQWVFGMHHITKDKIVPIVNFLGNQDLEFYAGYPSILHVLATTAEEVGVELKRRPRYVVTGAENVLDHQKVAIERFTGARVIDQYGFSEGCGNASLCPMGYYHEDFELGILECVDPEPLADGRVRGKVVCTGFANRGFPFVRYEVGDSAVWEAEGFRCACGRQSRVLQRIEGRMDDYVITPEGRRIMRFDYLFKNTQQVKEVQVVQEVLGEIVLKVVRREGYSAADETLIRGEVARWVSPELRVAFDYVATIQREPNGKFCAVKSRLTT